MEDDRRREEVCNLAKFLTAKKFDWLPRYEQLASLVPARFGADARSSWLARTTENARLALGKYAPGMTSHVAGLRLLAVKRAHAWLSLQVVVFTT